jgi:hypothetical protein
MGGSAADTPTPSKAQPAMDGGLRASDAEREQVAARLRDEYVAGRLSHETFVHRMHAVLEARHQGDLPPLVADLPGRAGPAQPPTARSLVGKLRSAWSRRRGPAGATANSQPGPPGSAGQPGQPGQAASPQSTVSPAGARLPGPLPAGRGVTIGMQTAAGESQPLSVRFPRGGEGEFSIGRDASCDLAIPDMTVSRRHATLERTPDGWMLTDLASTNGTRVNGWRVRGKVEVKAGDLVTFGSAEAVLIREDDLRPAADRAPTQGSRCPRLFNRDNGSARPAWADRGDRARADGLDARCRP